MSLANSKNDGSVELNQIPIVKPTSQWEIMGDLLNHPDKASASNQTVISFVSALVNGFEVSSYQFNDQSFQIKMTSDKAQINSRGIVDVKMNYEFSQSKTTLEIPNGLGTSFDFLVHHSENHRLGTLDLFEIRLGW